MSVKDLDQTGTELFQSYLRQHKDDVRSTAATNYYHVDVVAEAFSEGFSAGEKSGKKEFINKLVKNRVEEITQKATQVYILTNRVIDFIRKNKYPVDSFFINILHENPKVIITMNNEFLLNDDFVELAYTKVFEMKKIFQELFNCALDIGLMGSDHLDKSSLIADGFEYSEDFQLDE